MFILCPTAPTRHREDLKRPDQCPLLRPLSSSAKRTFGVTRGNITGQPRSWQIPPTRRACRHHPNNTTKTETPVFIGICSPAGLPGRSPCARGRCSPARTPTHPQRFPGTTSAGIIHMRGCSDVPPIPDRRTRGRGQHTRAQPTARVLSSLARLSCTVAAGTTPSSVSSVRASRRPRIRTRAYRQRPR